jgi:hypothetical protein
MISAKLRVPAGAGVQLSGGETSAPSHVNFLGIIPPSGKAVLEISKDIVPSLA